MFNDVGLQGRLTADPELKTVGQEGIPVLEFTLACDRDYTLANGSRPTDFIQVVAWRSTAEFIARYFTKGRLILVKGRIQVRQWKDQDGNKRRRTEILAESAYFCDSKKPEQGAGAPEPGTLEELPDEKTPFDEE